MKILTIPGAAKISGSNDRGPAPAVGFRDDTKSPTERGETIKPVKTCPFNDGTFYDNLRTCSSTTELADAAPERLSVLVGTQK